MEQDIGYSDGLEELKEGVRKQERLIKVKDSNLRELFVDFKTDLLDRFLQPHSEHLTSEHMRILREQLAHIMVLAKNVHDDALYKLCVEEDSIFEGLESLLEEHPSANVISNPDVAAALDRLRQMMLDQQKLIFDKHDILMHEQQHLINILEQIKEISKDEKKESELKVYHGPAMLH